MPTSRSRALIVAPIDGRVLYRLAEPGEVLGAGLDVVWQQPVAIAGIGVVVLLAALARFRRAVSLGWGFEGRPASRLSRVSARE